MAWRVHFTSPHLRYNDVMTGPKPFTLNIPDADIAEDRVVSTVGSYPATAPLGNPGPWVMQAVAFKAK